MQRDKTNLDIFWLKDNSLTDYDNLPAPDALLHDIMENLQAAMSEFAAMSESLAAKP